MLCIALHCTARCMHSALLIAQKGEWSAVCSAAPEVLRSVSLAALYFTSPAAFPPPSPFPRFPRGEKHSLLSAVPSALVYSTPPSVRLFTKHVARRVYRFYHFITSLSHYLRNLLQQQQLLDDDVRMFWKLPSVLQQSAFAHYHCRESSSH